MHEDNSKRIGITLTIVLTVMLLALAYARSSDFTKLQLNEWGDFLAGAAAAYAFIWLIAGYMQQGHELKLNTEALRDQEKRLSEQAKHTADLAAATRSLVELSERQFARDQERTAEDRRVRLVAEPSGMTSGPHGFDSTVTITNRGADVRNVKVMHIVGSRAAGGVAYLGRSAVLSVSLRGSSPAVETIFDLVFEDLWGTVGQQRYSWKNNTVRDVAA